MDIQTARRNLASLKRDMFLAAFVVAGPWPVYSISGRETKNSISQFPSQTGIGKQFHGPIAPTPPLAKSRIALSDLF